MPNDKRPSRRELWEAALFPAARTADDDKVAAIYAGRYKPMKDAPKDGTAILVLLDGSDIPLPIRWRVATDTMAKHGAGWYVTWDGYKLSHADGPRGWLTIPTEWLPETRPALVEDDCEDQGMSNVSEGCSKWPCNREPLAKTDIGWRCTKCGGSY